jgi:hypothetical protein
MTEINPAEDRDPLAATCPACLAPSGRPCIATSSDLPREHLHRLRSLTAATRLARCQTCGGSGWEPTGGGPSSPNLIVCPVCTAMPFTACTESGETRSHHEVRNRAASAGLGLCGTCDGIGWQPEDDPDELDTCRPVDVGGETIRVRGEQPLTEQSKTALAEVVRATRRRHEAERAAERADIERQTRQQTCAQIEAQLQRMRENGDTDIRTAIDHVRVIARGGTDG